MSTILGMFKSQKLTVWSESGYDNADRWGGNWNTPIIIDGRFMEGGTMTRGEDGSEFVPNRTIVTEYAGLSTGMRIAIGEFTDAQPVSNAETIRKVQTGTPLIGNQDYKILT
jgi:hypothetical protein